MLFSHYILSFCWVGTIAALSPRNYPSNNCQVRVKNPLPYGSICGIKGIAKHPRTYKTRAASSQNACQSLCWGDPKCLSCSYDSSSKKCSLNSAAGHQQSFAPSRCSKTWWDKYCLEYYCPPAGCGSGLHSCSGQCVSFSTDSQNCGGCGKACGYGSTCMDGVCYCSGDTATPIISTPNTDDNCGTCGNACQYGSKCYAGVCKCKEDDTEAVTQTPRDTVNCGSCRATCLYSSYCAPDLVCRCPGDYEDATMQPVSLGNCGVCNIDCADILGTLAYCDTDDGPPTCKSYTLP